jgi:hypothetical protein
MLLRLAFPAHHESGESYTYPNHLDSDINQVIVPPLYDDPFYLTGFTNYTAAKPGTPFYGLYNDTMMEHYENKHKNDPKKASLRWPMPGYNNVTNSTGTIPFAYLLENIKDGWKLGYVPDFEYSPLNAYLYKWMSEYVKRAYNDSSIDVRNKHFKSDDKLEDYVTKHSYDDHHGDYKKKVLFAVVVDKEPTLRSKLGSSHIPTKIEVDVKLRWNATDTRKHH